MTILLIAVYAFSLYVSLLRGYFEGDRVVTPEAGDSEEEVSSLQHLLQLPIILHTVGKKHDFRNSNTYKVTIN